MTFLWVITALGAIIGAGQFAFAFLYATSGPQQAAGAAMALCWAAIPYIFTRAAEATETATWRKQMLDAFAALRAEIEKGRK